MRNWKRLQDHGFDSPRGRRVRVVVAVALVVGRTTGLGVDILAKGV